MIHPITDELFWFWLLASELLALVLLGAAFLKLMQAHERLVEQKPGIQKALAQASEMSAKLAEETEKASSPVLSFSLLEAAILRMSTKHAWWLAPIFRNIV